MRGAGRSGHGWAAVDAGEGRCRQRGCPQKGELGGGSLAERREEGEDRRRRAPSLPLPKRSPPRQRLRCPRHLRGSGSVGSSWPRRVRGGGTISGALGASATGKSTSISVPRPRARRGERGAVLRHEERGEWVPQIWGGGEFPL
jgi:hypothetical protein